MKTLDLRNGAKAMLSETAPIRLQMQQGNLAVFTVQRLLPDNCAELKQDSTGILFTCSREDIAVISAVAARTQSFLYQEAVRRMVLGEVV